MPTQNGGRSELARDLGVRDRQPSVIDGHEKTSEYQRPRLRFHPYVRPTRPSLRPDLPFPPRSSEWRSRMAAKATALAARSVLEGRSLLRDPRRRRGVSGALPSSASGRPYRRWEAEAGSTSNSAIVIPSNNVIVLSRMERRDPVWQARRLTRCRGVAVAPALRTRNRRQNTCQLSGTCRHARAADGEAPR